jgi:hypothetical protein
MDAKWLASPLIALIRPAVAAVASDIWRRWQIGRRFIDPVSRNSPRTLPQITKAIADLEVLLGNNALITESVAGVLAELKSTGLLKLIAIDAFYHINDNSIKLYFEILFARHQPDLTDKQQRESSEALYDNIRFILRESLRDQLDSNLIFLFDTSEQSGSPLSEEQKIRTIMSKMRPDVLKSLELPGEALRAFKTKTNVSPSGLNKQHFSECLFFPPEEVAEYVKDISVALLPAYKSVRLDGPVDRFYDCEIDKLYVPARLTEADFSVTAHALHDRQRWLHNLGRCDEWNLCLIARTVVRANQERR